MGINQKGAIHLFLPVVILVAVAVFVSANIKTTIDYNSTQIRGVSVAKKGEVNGNNSSRNKSSDRSAPGSNAKTSGSQGGRSEEVRIQQEIRTTNEKAKDESLITTEIETEDEAEEASESADNDETIQELRAISKFPLRIDLATNQLIMTKNGVERVLTVLPAKAVQNMLRAHLKKGLGPKFFEGATSSATPQATPSATPSATSSAEPSSTPSASPTEEPIATESAEITVLDEQITLEEADGQFVYKIPAKKHLKLFGFIPMTTNFTGFVSAETGALIKEEESILSRFLDLLSP